MFNKDFYPTPKKLIRKMVSGVKFDNKRILEPSAGKGDIVDFINNNQPQNTIIDVLEIEPDLQSILYNKDCNVVGSDFLDFETVTEYDLVIMNPPFSEGDKHLLKAIDLVEGNVVKRANVICLLNAETLKNPYSSTRKKLVKKLKEHKANVEYINNAFRNAERKTDVSVALINLSVKPKSSDFIDIDFDNFDKVDFNKNEISLNVSHTEIARRKDEIEVLIELYDRHSEQLKVAYQEALKLNGYDKHLNSITKEIKEFGASTFVNIETKDINEEIQKLRYTYWDLILNTDVFDKKLTEEGKKKLRKTVVESSNLEITIDNVNKLISAMFQNMESIFKSDAIDLFRSFTKHNMNSYSGNIHYFDGWKTNDAFKVNKKIIVITEERLGGNELSCWQTDSWMDWDRVPEYTKVKQLVQDITKVFSRFVDYEIPTKFERDGNTYENSFLKLQGFKKGTTHLTFKDQEALDRFNIFCGIESGMLPEYEETKNNQDAKELYIKLFGQSFTKLIQ